MSEIEHQGTVAMTGSAPSDRLPIPTAKMLMAGAMVDWKRYADKEQAALDVWNVMHRNAPAPADHTEGTVSGHSVNPASLLQDHGCKFSSGHSPGFGDAEFTDESDKPVAVGELNGEVGGFDHGGSPLLAHRTTEPDDDLLTKVRVTLPIPVSRQPYDLRLQIGKALDRLVYDDSTPEEVDKFIETFREFGLTISHAPAVKHQLEKGAPLSGRGRLASSASSVTPLRNRAKSWLATIWPSVLSGRMLSIRQRASIARLSFSKSSESRKSNMFSLPSERTSSIKYREVFPVSQDWEELKIEIAATQAPAPKKGGSQ